MKKYKLTRTIILLIVFSLTITSIIFLDIKNLNQTKYVESVDKFLDYNSVSNKKTINFDSEIFYLLSSIIFCSILYFWLSFMFIFDFIFKAEFNKKTYKLINWIYIVYFVLASFVIAYFVYNMYTVYYDSFKTNFNNNNQIVITYTYSLVKSSSIYLTISYFVLYFFTFTFLIVNTLNCDEQLNFFQTILFIKPFLSSKKLAKDNNELPFEDMKFEYEKYYNSEVFKYVKWINEVEDSMVFQNHELEEKIKIYKYCNSFKNLISYSNGKLFYMMIGDEKFRVKLFPIYLRRIRESFYYISLSNYNRLIFKTAYFKLAKFVSATLDKNIEYLLKRIYTNLLDYKALYKGIIKTISDQLNDFLCVLYNKLRKHEYDQFKEFYEISKLIDFGKDYYYEIISNIISQIRTRYREIMMKERYKYNSNYNDQVSESKDNKVLAAFKYFNLTDNTTYENFKKVYRSYVKTYHPDLSNSTEGKNDDKNITLINTHKEVLNKYFKSK
ncbi:hypothetical protein SLITO_v1c05530 [Spiroplasma litorale]|uniref:J domain-containing protein n=1 Tax=Spiroplasma litorale TaxID=216942 RepID=A0A0K1W1Y8_9MOLU|nr:hypothetical protein [Spiroplasma litorale]AKX34193.1 hypothetical protein SLITO_v1c05530 [Spiroplasma litorale]